MRREGGQGSQFSFPAGLDALLLRLGWEPALMHKGSHCCTLMCFGIVTNRSHSAEAWNLWCPGASKCSGRERNVGLKPRSMPQENHDQAAALSLIEPA